MKCIRISIVATLALTVLVSVIYPVLSWGLSQVIFPLAANGSLIEKDGKTLGSRLLGQPFSSPGYFHSRPSSAGQGYDAASSGGSNLGPVSAKNLETVRQRADVYRRVNGLAPAARIPADAVTASGSGLDPHISPANALLQAGRVARERSLSDGEVRQLIEEHTDQPDLGILGDPGVNVVTLNLALDRRWP